MSGFGANSRRALIGAGAAVAGLAAAASFAQDAPRSILPEFMEPPAAQQPAEPPPPQPILPPPEAGTRTAAPAPPPAPGGAAAPQAAGRAAPRPAPGTAPGPPGSPAAALPADPLDTPAASRVDLARHGAIPERAGGYGPAAFAGADGRYLLTLMGRLDQPGASRWVHILLTRAMASVTPPPPGVGAANWAAARARLLMRMGEVGYAKALIDPIPVQSYTPGLYAAALDANLAAGDLAANCPIALTGGSLSKAPAWTLAAAMCAAFEGDDMRASNALDRMRDAKAAAPFDISLAERVASSLGGTRSANIEWSEVDRLNLYRVGLAAATGEALPETLSERLPAAAHGWIFRSAAQSEEARWASALPAAVGGSVSSAELAGFLARLEADGSTVAGEYPRQVRIAYAGAVPDRVEAMQALWADRALDRYGALVLTAGAAVKVQPSERFADAAPGIMAAALAGGRADRAALWWPVAEAAGGETARSAWPLAVIAGAPAASAEGFTNWADAVSGEGAAGRRRAALVAAAMVGLGLGDSASLRAAMAEGGTGAGASRWAARLGAAAQAGRRGEVALLAATGLQCDWRSAPPAHLAAIVGALRTAGMVREARLVAAEAVTRGSGNG